jgi:hypothetical protein
VDELDRLGRSGLGGGRGALGGTLGGLGGLRLLLGGRGGLGWSFLGAFSFFGADLSSDTVVRVWD